MVGVEFGERVAGALGCTDLLGEEDQHPLGVLAQADSDDRLDRGIGVECETDVPLEPAGFVQRQHLDQQAAHDALRRRRFVVLGRASGESGLDVFADHLQGEGHHLVLGTEVVLHHPGRDTGLVRDVTNSAASTTSTTVSIESSFAELKAIQLPICGYFWPHNMDDLLGTHTIA